MQRSIAVWDEDKKRADELIKFFRLFSTSDETLSMKFNVFTDYPGKIDIKKTDAFFLSFEANAEKTARARNCAASIRLENKTCLICLISDKELNLDIFYKPAIQPSGKITRPYTADNLKLMFGEVIEELKTRKSPSFLDDNEKFHKKSGEHYYSFFYRDIYFFEAFDKKIRLATTKGQEISFYGSLKDILNIVPPYFTQCHRSFIVNTRFIEKVSFKDNLATLTNGMLIDVSRTYADNLREDF